MNKIIIFGGTTEGRILSEALSRASVYHTVSVTSDYGNSLITPNEYAEVLTGRMDLDAMCGFLKKREYEQDDIVVDATHPYAVAVTSNIKEAVSDTGCRLIHIKRSGEEGFDGDRNDAQNEKVHFYDDPEECFGSLDDTEGNILLTTGSKELAAYRDIVSPETHHRTYVRVIPSADSLKICEDCGIEPSRIIAMQGPFGVNINEALIEQFDIRHMVTKQSGTAGGYDDKLKACRQSGIACHVIRRPAEDAGVTVREAYRMITGRPLCDERTDDNTDASRIITLAGYGMGESRTVTEEVRRAIEDADVCFGARRLTDHLTVSVKYPAYLAPDIIAILKDHPEYRRVVILFSGDSGFYSGAGSVERDVREWDPEAAIRILPGISSIACLAALTAESYDDAAVFSLHGRNSAFRLHELTELIRYNRKTYVLLSGDGDVRSLGERLKNAAPECRITVGENLSYETEKVTELTPEEAMHFTCDGILTALVINTGYESRPLIRVLQDDDLIRGKVPMTKECIRHESVIRLKLREGDIVYDIGGGTGSVALEAASLHPSLKVYTIERNAEAAGLIRQNIEALHMDNVHLIEGEAPAVLTGLDTPDAVFIGGSAGKLAEILMSVHMKGSGIRYVITSVSLETSGALNSFIEEQGIDDADIIQMQVSDIRTVGSHHMMQAQNPVMICSFEW